MPPNNWTDSAIIRDQKRTEESMTDIFDRCCGKNLFTIMYGKLYRCPFVSNAERLHAIPYNDKNGISLDASLDEIIKMLEQMITQQTNISNDLAGDNIDFDSLLKQEISQINSFQDLN